jgi:hypothetical protein
MKLPAIFSAGPKNLNINEPQSAGLPEKSTEMDAPRSPAVCFFRLL